MKFPVFMVNGSNLSRFDAYFMVETFSDKKSIVSSISASGTV
jgi:hypothetical protein